MNRHPGAQVPSGDEVVAMLRAAVATDTREAFTALLTEDVHWGGARGERQCRSRTEAGNHYQGLLAAGVTLRVAEAHLMSEVRSGIDLGSPSRADTTCGRHEAVLVQLEIRAPDPGDLPSVLVVRLTLLLERGASTNLFEAAALGLVARVEAHLTTCPTGAEITSGLWGACHGGQLEIAKVLIERGADPNWVGYDDLTPLGAAERTGASDMVDWLRGHVD